MMESIRALIFWMADWLRGGKIKNHLRDIHALVTDAYSENSKAKRKERLTRLLNEAARTTAFYAPYSGGDITIFPVINKTIIREHGEQFLSTSFSEGQRIPMITSGSTGTPFKTFQNPAKRERNSADTLFFGHQGGYPLGNKLVYLKIWSEYNKKSGLQQWIQNIQPVDVLNLDVKCKAVLEHLSTNTQAVSLLGYSSALETLCKFVDQHKAPGRLPKINSIITMSEALTPYAKEALNRIFGCPALSRYSNIENGIIAQQTKEFPDLFVVNTASYHLEIFSQEEDTPLPLGTLGRIVVTDYFNFAMPLIRYDTGDLGVLEEVERNGKRHLVLSRIEGRQLDQIFNTRGELISSYIVYRNMWNYTEITQYQFVQKSAREYVFKICMEGDFKRSEELIREFKEYLGRDADFRIEVVKEIPLLNSGKRKKVVNEMLRKG